MRGLIVVPCLVVCAALLLPSSAGAVTSWYVTTGAGYGDRGIYTDPGNFAANDLNDDGRITTNELVYLHEPIENTAGTLGGPGQWTVTEAIFDELDLEIGAVASDHTNNLIRYSIFGMGYRYPCPPDNPSYCQFIIAPFTSTLTVSLRWEQTSNVPIPSALPLILSAICFGAAIRRAQFA